MFWSYIDNVLTETDFENLNENNLSAGYLSACELEQYAGALGFSPETVRRCGAANGSFRSGVETYADYTFTELRIVNTENVEAEDDCVALFLKKNLLIVVDVDDRDGSTKAKYITSLKKHNPLTVTLEKLVCSFLDAIVSGDNAALEKTGNLIADMEEELLDGDEKEDFNRRILTIKKALLSFHNYYEQILDITEVLDDNENDIFPTDELMYVTNLNKKIIRLREDTDSLSSSLEHLQDAYSSAIDLKLNNHMKIFTVITTVFFPLTIIVGWYGMNFQSMPEFTWKYGYIYVIALSAAIVCALVIYGKKKKWF